MGQKYEKINYKWTLEHDSLLYVIMYIKFFENDKEYYKIMIFLEIIL